MSTKDLPPNHRSIRLVEMIVVESYEGEGTPADPGRLVLYWYEGEKLRFVEDPPWFAQRFKRETGTIWRGCPRCDYRWDTGKGPPA